ncbi:dihydroneopterin aldolase [Arthrobacter sp. H14]|uniref:dihydroneopterin aldolase n=1 Tax=Arthrobacter sp. H14 TaxID=1312959 RepID=UPI000479B3C2|nr:dihydroneopterin aldolase [Arthrobacter sp. H14]
MRVPRPDIIRLSGIAAIGYHGVFEHEKRAGQPFIADVVVYTDVSQAAATDDIARTTNYGELAEQVKAIITDERFNLIETLAERTAAHILDTFEVGAVEVTVHKPKAPIEVTFADVSVTVYRERP